VKKQMKTVIITPPFLFYF